MLFPEQPDAGLADALSAMRDCMAQFVPSGVDRERAEAALRRIEETALLGLAMQCDAQDDPCRGVFLVEPDGDDFRFLFVNQALAQMIGITVAGLAGERLSARPETARIKERCAEAIAACAPQRYDDRVDRPNYLLELHTCITPIYDSCGSCRRIVGISRDVTEQRVADRQLRKQNRRLQNILSCISDGFVVLDREWQISFVNARAEKLLGVARDRLIGADLVELLPGLRADRLREPAEVEVVPTGVAGGWLLARAYPSQDGIAIYLQDISERKQTERVLKQSLERMQTILDGVVSAMAYAVEMRDPYTGGHQRRVSALACAIARELGYSKADLETMRIAGLLHDIGKISIPSEILNRPGKLSEPERIIVRTHAQIGYEILKEIEFESPVALIALQHHERLDGSGYPQGLHGPDIIPEARILAIADVVEAMASHRPYRPALGVEIALKEVMTHQGVLYEDVAVGACLSVFTESGFDFDQLMQTELGRRSGEIELRHESPAE